MRLPELLAPAGGEKQLKAAVRFGADAVYLGANRYGMRAHAGNFDEEALARATAWCHARGVKVYLTLNIFAYDEDIEPLVDLAKYAVRACGVDALIMADPGAIAAVMDALPEAEIHLSTQMSTMNARAVRFWHDAGIKRVVLSREVSLDRIKALRAAIPQSCELEAFVHGAVCMSYSGRCTLSKYLTGRDANRGDCAQACRWTYRLEEQKRPGEYFPVEETESGVHIFSAGDMNMLPYLDQLCGVPLDSLKIEGRMKNEYYVATVVGAYRQALNAIARGEFDDETRARLSGELLKISHRPYDTGFYFGAPEHPGDRDWFTQSRELAARVLSFSKGRAMIEVKNKILSGDSLELMTPAGTFGFTLGDITRADGAVCSACPQPNSIVTIDLPHPCEEGDLIRGTCRNHQTGE
ncbi:MAG: U32 family peptidase [Clostridiales bacterium]|nr:U32 family peptidase [Clostridiales bacterium]MDY2872589.1 U32 family peptidase [Eubacteriales bacterium]